MKSKYTFSMELKMELKTAEVRSFDLELHSDEDAIRMAELTWETNREFLDSLSVNTATDDDTIFRIVYQMKRGKRII